MFALTNHVRRLARGELPNETLPLLTAATLLPIQPQPGKTRPIAIAQALRRLATKTLLGPALADTRDYLAPCQLANDIAAGMDSIVYEIRMKVNRFGREDKHAFVAIDASNAFKNLSRQQLLDLLPDKALSLAAFINMVYARIPPTLIIPSSSSNPRIIHSVVSLAWTRC